MNKLTIEERQCGLEHLKRLRVELQQIVDSKNAEYGMRKRYLHSRISFLQPKVKTTTW